MSGERLLLLSNSLGREPLLETLSVDLGVVVAVGVLQPGDHLRPVLDFQVSLEYLDVHMLAFGRAGTGGAGIVKREVAIMGFQKL